MANGYFSSQTDSNLMARYEDAVARLARLDLGQTGKAARVLARRLEWMHALVDELCSSRDPRGYDRGVDLSQRLADLTRRGQE